MASLSPSSSSLALLPLCLAALLLLLAAGADARPCKTLFVSYYTISSAHPKPTLLKFPGADEQKPSELFVFAEFRHMGHRRSRYFSSESALPVLPHHSHHERPAGYGSPMRDRTRDVLGVVTSLLFGVGCGMLASAAMYLVWLVVTGPGGREADDEDEEDDVKPATVGGYVKVPAAPVKEGYEGN